MAMTWTGTYILDVKTGKMAEANQLAISVNKNMKEAANSSSKLGKAASGALNSTRTRPAMDEREYERARGVTGKTGASGRDFAKQAEGLGGLVRLYATFAANIFAVTQAFEVLKRSYQFEQLQKASEAFAITTGKNLSGIAKELRVLSDGALTAKAAQQFANYGQSAGFTADQLRRLVGVARGASQALGRDFSDAIDRLIRGTGKLEPELLDEIGLLTRTKTAGEAYAKSLGKTFEQLTQFEKVQAFTNAVIEEGERKFGAVSKAVPVSAFERFAAAAIDAGTAVSNFVNKAIVPLLDVLANNPALIVAGLIATIAKLASTALPFINNLAAKARQAAKDQADYAIDKEREALKAYQSVAEAKQAALMHGVNAAKKAADVFVQEEGKKLAAINKTAAAVQAQRGNTENVSINALATVNSSNMIAAQKTIEQGINRQLGAIKSMEEAKARGAAIDEKKLATHRQTLTFLTAEKAKVDEIIADQVILNRLKGIQTAEEAKIAAVLDKQVSTAQRGAVAEQLRSQRANAIYQAVNAAQAKGAGLGVGAGFQVLNNELRKISTSTAEANKAIEATGGKVSAFTKASFSAGQGMAYMTGAVKILGTGLIGLATGLAGALGIISLLYFAFDAIIKVAGGYSDKIDAANESVDTLTKSNRIALDQAVEFNNVIRENSGSLNDWARVMEYSANSVGAIADNLSKASKDMAAFEMSSGFVSKAWQSMLSVFGKDIGTKFATEFKSSIASAMSLSSGSDKAKIEKAILALFPNAKTIEEAVVQFEGLNAASKAFRGAEVAAAINKVNMELKSSAANLKAASDGWTKVGDALGEYNQKAEVKDPKLKDLVGALRSIETAYAAASTEAEKALVLSGMTIDQQKAFNKLAKERGIDTAAFNKLLDEARIKTQRLTDLQKEQAAVARQSAISAAEANTAKYNPNNQSQFDALKDAQTKFEQVSATIRNTQLIDPEQIKFVNKELANVGSNLIVELERAAAGSTGVVSEGYKFMIENLRKLMPQLTEMLASGIGSGIAAGWAAWGPAMLAATKDFRALENEQDPSRGRAATKEQVDKAAVENSVLGKLNAQLAATSKQEKAKAKISKYFELEVKNAQALLDLTKQQASLEQESIGYITKQTQEEGRIAQLKVNELNHEKLLEELQIDSLKRQGKQAEAAAAQERYNALAVKTANLLKENTDKLVVANDLRITQARERAQLEKEEQAFLKVSLDIQNQILDIAEDLNLVSSVTVAETQAAIGYSKQQLEFEQRTLAIKQAEERLSKGINNESADAIAVQKVLLDIDKQRAVLTKELAIAQAKYNEYVDTAKDSLDAVSENLSKQLDFTISLVSQAENQARAMDEMNLLAQNIVIEFDKLPKSQQNAINAENMLLDAASKVLETKKQIYELNAKTNSGADFGETVKQGLEVAALDFAKSTKSLAQATVDGMVGAIDATIDALFDKMKAGGKISLKEIMKAGTDFIKNAMLDFVSNSIKQSLRDSLAGLFGGQSAEQQQKQAIEDLKKAIKDAEVKHQENTATMRDLIKSNIALEAATRRAAEASLQSASTAPTKDAFAAASFMTPGGASALFKPAADAATTLGQRLLAGGESTEFFTETAAAAANATIDFGGTMVQAAQATTSFVSSLSSMLGGGGGGITSGGIGNLLGGLSNIFGPTGSLSGVGNTFASIFSGNAAELAADFVGPPTALANAGVAGSSAGMFAGMMGGASTGAAIGSLAAGLFGNERNSQGMQIGGTIGGIAGSFFGPLGSIIGSALGSALGSLWKSGGGPKSGGFAQSGEGFDRFYTPDDKDSELGQSVKNISSAYDSIIKQLGGSGKANFGLGFDTDPKGTANSRVTAGVMVNGKEITTTTEAGRSAEELTKELEAASSRLLLTAIKNSDLPENVAAYYAGITDEVIKTMSKEDVESKLDFGSVLGTIAKERDKIAEIFGEDLYNLTEKQLEPFRQGTEKLSETFARLTGEFAITSRVVKFFGADTKKVFGAVGLASSEMRSAMIEGAGGIEAFTNQFNYFMEEFYTEIERAGFEFSSAGETVRSGFLALNMSVPATMAGFRDAVTNALRDGNVALYNSLMELAPAFNAVRGSIEDVMGSINEMSMSLLDRIKIDTQSAEQNYKMFKDRADAAQLEIDKIMLMSPEALIAAVQAGTISPERIEELSTTALQNAEAAWGYLSDEQRAIMGPMLSRFVTTLNANTASVLETINTAINANPKPEDITKPATDPTTSEDVVPPTAAELLTVPERTGTAIAEGFAAGAQTFSNKLLETFSTLSLEGVNPLGTQPLSPDAIESQRLREEQQAAAQLIKEEQERVNQENQAAAFAAMADKLLGAANGMLSAAASMQAAASTPQTINVTVETLNDDTSAEVGVN